MKGLPQQSEHSIQTECNNYLRFRGWYVERLNAGKFGVGEGVSRRFIHGVAAGTPDSFAFRVHPSGNGVRLLFIEYKTPKNKPTPLQETKMAELEDFGALCHVIRSLDELIELEKRLRTDL